MKINNVLKQTALAAAIAAVSFGAVAGDLTITTPAVLANEIFGDQSETTSIRLPLVEFKATAALVGKPAAGATIKLTLAGQPIFAENYQDPNSWADQGIEVNVNGSPLAPADIVDVVGGTANDNQITIKLAASVAGNFAGVGSDVTLEGFKVKRLKDALKRDAAEPVRLSNVTLEVRSGAAFENTGVEPAFVSINGLAITSTSTAANRQMIQVGAGQKEFTTSTGNAAAKDFTSKTTRLDLGTLTLSRGKVPATNPGAGKEAGKETGEIFDFTGGDTIKLTLNSNADLTPYGALTLQTGACNVASAGVVGTFSAATSTIEVPTSSVNLDAATAWNLCATVDGDQVIPQASFDASVLATYLNVRYTQSTGAADYGRVLRNGCQVTLFNLPNVGAADNAFIRFTNTSDVDVAGEVTATIWGQDGKKVLENELVLDALKPHATAVLHTSQVQGSDAASNVVYLGEALPEFAKTSGRSRIVLNGAFPSCEALGLVRSANGTLVNMTSTVYSGSENGTSNTTN